MRLFINITLYFHQFCRSKPTIQGKKLHNYLKSSIDRYFSHFEGCHMEDIRTDENHTKNDGLAALLVGALLMLSNALLVYYFLHYRKEVDNFPMNKKTILLRKMAF